MNTQVAKKSLVLMVVAGLAASGLFLVSAAHAASRTWSGISGSNFNLAGDWDVLPVSTDSIFFDSTSPSGTILSNDFANGFSFAGITFNAGALPYTLNNATSTNVYALTGAITNSSTNLETINFNISMVAVQNVNLTTGGGNLTFGGIVSGAGGLTLAGTGTLTLSAANTYTGATTTATGTVLKLANVNALQNSVLTDGANGSVAFDTTTAGATTFNIGGLTGTGNISLTDFSNSSIAVTASIGSRNTTPAAYTGDLSGIGGVTKVGTGTLAFGANQDYTGATIVNNGAITTTGNLASQSLTVSAGSLAVGGTSAATTLNVNGGTMTITGAASATQLNIGNGTFTAGTGDSFTSGTNLTAGTGANIATSATVAGSGILALNTITRGAGAGVNFTLPTSGNITAINANTGGSILGGWATVGGTDWAVSAGTGSVAGAITALGSYTSDTWASGNNTTVTTSSSPTSDSTTNSLRFGAAAANTVTLSGTNTITSGGILDSSAVGNNASTITGGSLQAASGGELVLNQEDASNTLTIASSLVDNGTSGLTKLGAGTAILTGSNSYVGATRVTTGILQIGNGGTSGTLGTGGNVVVGGNLVYNRSDSSLVSNAISGAGTITVSNPSGTGTMVLTNAGNFTGPVVSSIGTLSLDFSSSALSNNIVNTAGTSALTVGAGGTLKVTGASAVTNSQTFASTTWAQGVSTIIATDGASGGTANLELGALTRQDGAETIFELPTTGLIHQTTAASSQLLNLVAGPNGTKNHATSYGLIADSSGNVLDLAGVDGSGNITLGKNVGSYVTNPTGGTAIGTASTVVEYTTDQLNSANTLSNTTTGNALVFDTATTSSTIAVAGTTTTVGWSQTLGNNRTFTIARILETSAVGATNVNLGNGVGGNGSLRADASGGTSGADLVLDQYNTGGYFLLTAPVNNGGTDVFVKNGPGTLQMLTTGGYTGQTYLNGGVTEINANAVIGAAATGAQINLNSGSLVAITNSFALDNGTNIRPLAIGTQGGGLGAVTGLTMTVNGAISGAAGTGALTIGVPASSANGSVVGQIPGTGTGTANTTAVSANGTVILTGSTNTYTGGTNVVSGTLLVTNAAGSATGTGAVTVGGIATLGGGNSGGTTGFITGAVSLQNGGQLSPGVVGVNNGIGTIKLGGVSFATGSILDADLSGGGNDKAISTNGLSLASGTKVNLFTAGSGTAYALNGTFTLFDVMSGSVPSVGSLNSNFTINNPHAGATYLWGESSDGSGGTNVTLQISGLTPIYNWVHGSGSDWQTGTNWDQLTAPGSPGDAVSFNSTNSAATGATSVKLNGARTAGQITFNDTAAQFSIDPGSPVGTLILNNNGNGASITNGGGTHAIAANITLADNVSLTVANPGDTLTISGNISGGNNLSATGGSGTTILTGTNSYANTNVDTGNTLQIGDGVSTVASLGTGNVTLNGTLTINRPNAYNITNGITNTAIAPSGTLVQAGAGTTTLSGTNSGYWSTTVNAGTLQIGSGSTLGTGNLTMGGGILDLGGNSISVNSLNGTSNINNVSAGGTSLITVNAGGTYSGNITNTTGTVSLTKAGTGTLTISGIDTYDGDTNITGGTLVVASSTAVKAGTNLINQVAGGLLLGNTAAPITIGANITLTEPAGNSTQMLDVVPNSQVTITGNILQNGAAGGSQIRIDAGNEAATSLTFDGNINTVASITVFERGNFIFAGNSIFTSTSGTGIWLGRNAGSTVTFLVKDNAQISGTSLSVGGGGNVTNTAAATFTMQDSAMVTATGSSGFNLNGSASATCVATTNLNGGTLNTQAFFAANTSNINFNGGTVVATASSSSFLPAFAVGAANVQAGGAKFNSNGFDITLVQPLAHDPSIVGSDGGLMKSGAGSLTLSSTNTYTGNTTVSGGVLIGSVSNAISSSPNLILNGGGFTATASNAVSSSTNLVLNGGTFSAGGHSQSLNNLQVQTGSTVDMGPAGSHDNPDDVQFANSSAQSWSGVLRVKDWAGLAGGGGQDQVLFGNSSGLTSGQLSDIHFNGYLTGAKFVGSSGEIVPLNTTTHLILGDVNNNTHVDAGDIVPFEQALANLAGYESTNSYDFSDVQDIMDINGDGLVNNADLQAFFSYLNNGHGNTANVPEPSSLVLFGLALPAVWVAARRRRNRV